MNTPYAKLGATLTYVWRDVDTTRRAAVAPYTVVYRWINAAVGSGGHGPLPENDPILSAHAVVSTINPSAASPAHAITQGTGANANTLVTLYRVGVTQGLAIDAQQVGVMVSGLTPLIVQGPVEAGDILVAAIPGTSSSGLVQVFTTSHELFQRVPHIRPLLHPYWGREVSLLVTPVRSLNRLNRGTVAFDASARFIAVGVAETASGVTGNEWRIITARIEPITFY